MEIRKNIPLAPHTTFKIGGPADFFVEAKSQVELVKAIEWAGSKKTPFYIIGNGSNILVSDQGFRGLIIKLKLTELKIDKTLVSAGAGVSSPKLAKEAAKKGLTGLEFLIGIPGTVGGAVYGNAGNFGGNTKDVFKKTKVLKVESDKIEVAEMKNRQCKFGYRDSIFKKNKNWIILEALFKLKKSTKQICEKRIVTLSQQKTTNQPMGKKCAGSIFKNPPGQSAWKLISKVNMKGKQVGGAMVSYDHANFIINTGKATAEHVVILIAMIKQRVRSQLGIQLQEEIQYVGF